MQAVSTGHRDMVLAVDFNYFGTRMVSAGADHRLEVCDKKDDTWVPVDRWKAHDAEVTDVKWNGPFMGDVLASIGEDGHCKLWQEDCTEVIMSGNRFKLIANIKSMTHTPFMSVDFKFINNETWLALITRDGFLTVWEPTDPNSLNEWTSIAELWVCGDNGPGPQHEVGFKAVFHKEKLPCWKAIQAGLDRKSLGLAVAAMNDVFVFRTDKNKKFFRVAVLKGARDVIRDVAWANGSMRGSDLIATASKDGAIRIYELSTLQSDKSSTGSNASPSVALPAAHAGSSQPGRSGKNTPSGIGAGLAGASKSANYLPQDHELKPGQIRQEAKLVDELTQHHGAVWRVAFSQMGDLLVSTGDDGIVRSWKRDKDGHWLEYAEVGGGSRE
ncbi:WD40 repeat-like protein [Polyplosphaeria fusca]|uniref:WD40 repeat-like protein n=1 Tax=Polyplosphaeria fusca TaxID=682080 RepID=A0A9P4UWB5_9PLEO|nr:WD40 repeat-like protein [Polyplosphaeria fusca]